MDRVEVVVVGAGVVGLAVARELAAAGVEVFVLEREARAGEGVSSRNSEVLHSGIYYPEGTLKSRTAIEGNRQVRQYLEEKGIAATLKGKLIVATTDEEVPSLLALHENAKRVGVEAHLLDGREARAYEPAIECVAALYVPSAGVFDTHAFVRALLADAEEGGAFVAYGARVLRGEPGDGGWILEVRTDDGEEEIAARVVVNAAGLDSSRLAAESGFDVPPIHPCKGRYFSLVSSKARLISRPVYPIPGRYGLGIHLTPDVRGEVKLGPDTVYVDEIDYSVGWDAHELFYTSVKRFFPALEPEDIAPAMSGIRPKIQGPGDPFMDFHVSMDAPGFVNMVGIESPGLTASMPLARLVRSMVLGSLGAR